MRSDSSESCVPEQFDVIGPDVIRALTANWGGVDGYFADSFVEEDDALRAARQSGSRTTMPSAEVSASQGAFLGLMAQIAGARRVLEFGTLAGYSTIWLARAVGDTGQVITLELEPSNAEIALANFSRAGVADRVEVVVGPAGESAQQMIDLGVPPFDLVFIDADKQNNPLYLALSLELTHSGAVIIIDNVVRGGAVVDASSTDPRVQGVRSVVSMIAANDELSATALQTVGVKGWDGMILIRCR